MEEYRGPKDTPMAIEAKRLQKAISPYVQKAKETLPLAKRRYIEGLPLGYSFFVTVELTDTIGNVEISFVRVTEWKERQIIGILSTATQHVIGYKMGQKLKIDENRIIDWTITAPDGTEEGNFVGKFMDTYAQ